MADLDIPLLRSFAVAAAEGSFSAAGRRLHCTQGAISLRIKTLEERAGTALFKRNYHRLALTAAGQRLLPLAREILRLHDEARVGLDPSPKRSLRLGVAEDYTGAHLSALLACQARVQPDLALSLICGNSPELIRQVDARELDIAIVTPPGGEALGTLISRRRLVWICLPGFVLPEDDHIPLSVYTDGCTFRRAGVAALNALGWRWRIVMSSPSGRGVLAAVEAGLGLTIMAEGTVPAHLREAPSDWGLPALGDTEIRLVRRPDAPAWMAPVAELLVNAYESAGADRA